MTFTRPITRSALDLARSSRRTYATAARPPLAQGGSNRNIIIGLSAISLTAVGYFYTREASPGTDTAIANQSDAIVNNPSQIADRKPTAPRTREERQQEGKHPEDLDDKYRAKFGVVHERKRVDGPPDGRNHQQMHDRAKEAAKGN